MRAVVFALLLPLVISAGCSSRDGRGGLPSVRVGRSVTGTLDDRDPRMRGDRGPYDTWLLRGSAGQRLVIELSSSAFDPFLTVRRGDGYYIGSDDDSGEGLGARFRTILPASGVYRIVATAVGSGGRGTYTLTVSEWVVPDAPRAGAAQSIAVGEEKGGLLEPGDELTGDGPYQDRWSFDGSQGQAVRVEMRSSDLDSYVIVLGPDGQVLGTNDDASGRDAILTVMPRAAGRHTLLATTYGNQPSVGAYRVTLSEVSGEFSAPGVPVPISEGQTTLGRLESGDATTERGSFTDIYLFRPATAGEATIDLSSSEFDAYLTLQDSTGMALATDDDGGEGFNSLLRFPVAAGGSYRIVVGTYGVGQRAGAYQLRVSVRDGQTRT